MKRFLPQVLAATTVVIVLPIGLVSLLAGVSALRSLFVSMPLAMLVSLAASSAGSTWWKKRPNSHVLVFSDLMVWGWVRRLRTERRLSRAVELLGTDSEVPRERQVACFEELASALEARDPYTHGHTRRVTAHAVAIAERMGLSREQVAKVRTAAAIHDIGKLNTPREVLNKAGRLTDEEFEVIKRHPVDGAGMAARLGDEEVTAMVRHHHERLDGTGYPGRLAGAQIPLGARIIAVADTFDAIISRRPYRGASSHKKGIAILTKEAGTQLDPDAVRAFCSHYSGRRGVATWSLLTSAPGRLVPWNWGLSSATSLTKSAAALAVAGVLGGSAAELAKPASGHGLHRLSYAARAGGASARRPTSSPLTRAGHGRQVGAAIGNVRHRGGAGAPHRKAHHARKSSTRSVTNSSSGAGRAAGGATSGRPATGGDGRGSSAGGGAVSSGGGSSSSGGSTSSSGGSSSPPTGTPTLPGGTPTVPTVTPTVPTGTPTVPIGTPSLPVKPPTLP